MADLGKRCGFRNEGCRSVPRLGAFTASSPAFPVPTFTGFGSPSYANGAKQELRTGIVRFAIALANGCRNWCSRADRWRELSLVLYTGLMHLYFM